MEIADALAADELWGWPVDVLERLLDLRQRAGNGEISLEDWREQDAAVRAAMPAVDLDEVRQFEDRWVEEWVIKGLDDEGERLTGRLTALTSPAPSNEQLWGNLARMHEALADRRQDRRRRELYESHRDRIVAWLTWPSGDIDAETGLPWPQVAQYRIIDDPDLGPVPQYVDSARRLAEKHATTEDRERAEMVRDRSANRRLAASRAKLEQNRLTWLPDLLHDGIEEDATMRPLLADLAHIWGDPRVQRLLIAETSHGWPADYNRDIGG
ncbi:hypothetical protein K1W54_02700 [Micromonospora sp. CPCC 205371]|nr:hypothetical protein [Micromonospora sp. CPCC 205371]